MHALFLLAELAVAQGTFVEGAERLGLAQQQPTFATILNFHKRDVEQLLEALQEQLAEEELEEALERGKRMNLEEVVPELLATLDTLLQP